MGYAGGQYDGYFGGNLLGGRGDLPADGIWASQDPLGLGAGPNPYEYSNNGPTNFIDPTGLDPPGGFDPVRALQIISNAHRLQTPSDDLVQPYIPRWRPFFTACTRCHAIHGFGAGQRPWWIDDFGNVDPAVVPVLSQLTAESRLDLFRMIPMAGGVIMIGEGATGYTMLGTPLGPGDRVLRV